jgi:DeoR/GlpR family transcriptional regulator of sugar metabolism
VLAAAYGWSTGGDRLGPLTAGYWGAVGDHLGYTLLVATGLAGARGVDVVVTGGSLRGSIHALVGGTTEQALATVQGTRAFISGNGLTAARGLSTPNLTVAGVDRALAAAADEVVVLADHTKIGTEALLQTVAPEDIQHVVTDDASDPAELDALRELGITVHVAATAANAS